VLCGALIAIVTGRDESRNLMWLAMSLKKTKQNILFYFLNNYLCIKHINSECTYKIILYWNFLSPKPTPNSSRGELPHFSREILVSVLRQKPAILKEFFLSFLSSSPPKINTRILSQIMRRQLHFTSFPYYTSYHSTLQNFSFCASII